MIALSWRRHGSGTDHAHVIDFAGETRRRSVCGETSETMTDPDQYDHEARTCDWCRNFADKHFGEEKER